MMNKRPHQGAAYEARVFVVLLSPGLSPLRVSAGVPEHSGLASGPVLTLFRCSSYDAFSPRPVSESHDRTCALSLDSPASAPAAANSFPGPAMATAAVPYMRSCASAANCASYKEGIHDCIAGAPGGTSDGLNAAGEELRYPAPFLLLPGEPRKDARASEGTVITRRDEERTWKGGILEGLEEASKYPLAGSILGCVRQETPGALGCWVASSSTAMMRSPSLNPNCGESGADATTGCSSAPVEESSAAGRRRWGEALGWCRLIGVLAAWFCLLLSAASLLQLRPSKAATVLGIVAPATAVLLFLSPAAAANKALREGDSRGLPVGVFAAQAVSCAVAVVYGVRINSSAIFVTNAAGAHCWCFPWCYRGCCCFL